MTTTIDQLADLKIQESSWMGPNHGYSSPPARIWNTFNGGVQLVWWDGTDVPGCLDPRFELSIVGASAFSLRFIGAAPRNLAQARASAAAIFAALGHDPVADCQRDDLDAIASNPALAAEIATEYGLAAHLGRHSRKD